MVTARRSNETSRTMYEQSTARGGVQVLERPLAYEEFAQVSVSDAAAERRKNLNDLLNYDRYSAEVKEQETVAVEAEAVIEEKNVSAVNDEDCKPTATTLQFGQDIDIIREDMKATREENDVSIKLNKKGKIVLVMYALVVTVIMALIVINTGVLASLGGMRENKTAELNTVMEKYSAIQTEIENISSDDYIANKAQEMGMVLGN